MPPKALLKPNSKIELRKSEVSGRLTWIPQRLSDHSSQELALQGLNKPINSRSASLRTLDKKSSAMPVCTASNCLHNSSRCEMFVASERKILSDRPGTGGHGSSRKHQFSSFRRPLSSREERRDLRNLNDWARPSSSQSNDWSSVDSELATAGSVTDMSLEDKQSNDSQSEKQSFAVFSSFSFDSQENLTTNSEMPPQVFGGDIGQPSQPEIHSSPVIIQRIQSHEKPNNDGYKSNANEQCKSIITEEQSINSGECSSNESAKEENKTEAQSNCLPNVSQLSTAQKNVERKYPSQSAVIEQIRSVEKQIGSFLKIPTQELFNSHHNPVLNERKITKHKAVSNKEGTEEPQIYAHNVNEINSKLMAEDLKVKEPNMQRAMHAEILNFLDDANQQANSNSPVQTIINSETESTNQSIGGGHQQQKVGCESVNKLHGMTKSQLADEVLALQMLAQDKDNKLVLMERALQNQKELFARSVKSAQRELNIRCKAQKEEYEATLNRHVHFIQQLVEEKKKLADKCESLATEMRQQNSRFECERRVSEERHNTEIKRLKQTLGRDHRYHQEKWVADRTEHIREVTARGLEPELRRLMGQHQIELQSLRAIHQEELLRAEQTHMAKTVQQINALRERMNAEKEDACAKERENARIKYEKQCEDLEILHNQKYQRLQNEIERERKGWLDQADRTKALEEENMCRLEEKWRKEKLASQQLHEANITTMKQQHMENIALVKRKLEEEKRLELEDIRKTKETEQHEREKQLIDQHRLIEQQQHDNFNRQLSEELKRQHEEWKIVSEQQLQRMHEKHKGEVERLDKEENDLRNKLVEVRRMLTDRDEELASLRLTLFQHVKENKEIKKTLEQFTAERTDLRNILQKELENDLTRLEEDKVRLQEQFSRFKSDHRIEINKKNSEIAQLSASHEKMLIDIHEKVKITVLNKDSAISELNDKFQSALHRCQHLEELIDRQNRDMLGRKKLQLK